MLVHPDHVEASVQEQEAVAQVPWVAMQQVVARVLEDKAEMVLVHIVHFY
jgi:Ni,Fe-hydrogenase I large subunit